MRSRATLEDMVDQSVGRVLDLFGLSWIVRRWARGWGEGLRGRCGVRPRATSSPPSPVLARRWRSARFDFALPSDPANGYDATEGESDARGPRRTGPASPGAPGSSTIPSTRWRPDRRSDQLQIARLKKKKLVLRDQIAKLEDRLMPDIIA